MTDRADFEFPLIAGGEPALALVATDAEGGHRRIPCRRAVTLLGGRTGCKVRLSHRSVAPVHAALVHDGTRVRAVDMVTRHGTAINDLRIEQEVLQSGDMLGIDPWTFEVVIEPGEASAHTSTVSLEPEIEMVGLEHVESKRLLHSRRAVCIIGRRAGCDIVLNDPAVSRVHAVFFHHRGRPAVADLLSENGITVNDQPVRCRALDQDDILTIGSTQFRVRIGGLAPETGRNGSAGVNGKVLTPSPSLAPPEPEPDLVNIKDTEGSQHWRIAESLEKTNKPKS